jgi:RNA polymerase sigma-70 factor (ECF subfamily)
MEDRDLLARARKGDEGSFLEVYTRHRDAVFRFAYRMTGAADRAEDLAHDCWLALLDGKARWNPDHGALRAFLLGVVRNLAMRRFRWANREGPEAEDAFAPDDPLDDVWTGEIGAAVARAVAELPALQREALVLFEYEELSLEEIAGIAGVEAGTIKARLHRARETLRRRLASVRSGI